MRVLRFEELRTKKGIRHSRQHLQVLIKQGKFPASIRMGPHRVGWIEDEVDAHLENLAKARTVA